MCPTPLHPGRPTISWITGARLAVCWADPASPARVHGSGVHWTSASVRGRLEMLNAFVLKSCGFVADCPSITRFTVLLLVVLVANWTCASTIVEPTGIATLRKRTPTVWAVASNASCRSLLPLLTAPDAFSSASSALATTGMSKATVPSGFTVTMTSSLCCSAVSSAVSRRT